jgi:hypothetical protein
VKKPKTKKRGRVKQVIKSPVQDIPEKAEITIDEADPLYQEIRIENKLEDEKGNEVKLKEGAEVDVIVEADSGDTIRQEKSKVKKA